MPLTLDKLPVELIATILSYLELDGLVNVIAVSKLLANVCKDPFLNPWRSPIHHALSCYISNSDVHAYDDEDDNNSDTQPNKESRILEHLSCYTLVPKNNWIDILAKAPPSLILFHEIPWLPDHMWQEAFMRRFLPSWARWKKNHNWKQTFLMILWRVWHRLNATCTTDEPWTNYIILSRQGIVNSAAASSRQYNPQAVLNIYKEQNNLRNLPTTTRLIVQLADVRIIAMGTLVRSSSFQINKLAKEFVQPTGVHPADVNAGEYLSERLRALQAYDDLVEIVPQSATSDISEYSNYYIPMAGKPLTRSLTLDSSPQTSSNSIWRRFRSGTLPTKQGMNLEANGLAKPLAYSPPSIQTGAQSIQAIETKQYNPITHPQPIDEHYKYPNFTSGGLDKRWPVSYDGTQEHWIGPLLVTALLVPTDAKPPVNEEGRDDEDELLRRIGSGRSRWASFTADDLDAIAPWLSEHIDKKMEGMGLGL